MSRPSFRYVPVLLCIACMALGGVAVAAPSVSVTDHGAIGDGKHDDTDAFHAAIKAAAALPPGRTVIVPPGTYRLTAPLVIDNLLLEGHSQGGWNTDSLTMPVLNIAHRKGPALRMNDDAAVHGLHFHDTLREPETPDEGPPTILIAGGRPSITNIKIDNAWDGIICQPKTNTGRLHIGNVFMIDVAHVGVDIEHTWDIPTMENVEVWNPSQYPQENLTAFRFGHNDGMRASNLFVFRCKTGFEFYESDNDIGFWGELRGCSTDQAVTAFKVHDAKYLTNVGGYHLDHMHSWQIDAPAARIAITGGNYKTNAGSILEVTRVKQLAVSGCVFYRGMERKPGIAHALLHGGENITLAGCSFGQYAPGIFIGKDVETAAITGNAFSNVGFPAIIGPGRDNDYVTLMGNSGPPPARK